MAWLRIGDTSASHSARLRLNMLAGERQGREAWGFAIDCAATAAQNETDYFVSGGVAYSHGRSRTNALAKLLVGAGLWVPHVVSGEDGWRMLDDPNLWHMRTREEIEQEKSSRPRRVEDEVAVRLRDGDECRYCRVPVRRDADRRSTRGGQYDHVVPGQPDVVVSCRGCNREKAGRSAAEWEAAGGRSLKPPPEVPFYSARTRAWFESKGVPYVGRSEVDLGSDLDRITDQTQVGSGSDLTGDEVTDLGPPGRAGSQVGSGSGRAGSGGAGSGPADRAVVPFPVVRDDSGGGAA